MIFSLIHKLPSETSIISKSILVVPVHLGNDLATQLAPYHDVAAILKGYDYKPQKDKTFLLPHHSGWAGILVVGLGVVAESQPVDSYTLGGCIAKALLSVPYENVIFHPHWSLEAIAGLTEGLKAGSWRFNLFCSQTSHTSKHHTWSFCVPEADKDRLHHQIHEAEDLIDSVLFSRHLAHMPSNHMTPQDIIKEAQKLEALGLKVSVLDVAKLKEMGAGALLGVGQGSVHPPALITLHWQGDTSDKKPFALVGKGVTFDSGGVSIKPSANMHEMKSDMSGAAVIMGVMRALAKQRVPLNVVASLAIAENMPSGSAQRPGDVVKSLSGKTIEILDTDAEGRLILADALWYVQETFKPHALVDVATLTGGVRVALGSSYAGLCSTASDMAKDLRHWGEKVGEPLWQLPLNADYDKSLDSPIADMQNIPRRGFGASCSVAAQFLGRFIQPHVKWCHLDIASTDWSYSPTPCAQQVGPTAFGVRLLYRWLKSHLPTA